MNHPRPTDAQLKEHKILSNAERVDGQLVRVEALRYTRGILRKAGYLHPIPFHRYLVPVRYRQDNPLLQVAQRTPRAK